MKRITKDTDGTYRLRDMDIEEVSMVDRAANRRTFLFAKNAEGAMQAELMDKGDGTLELAPEAPAAGTDDAGVAKMELAQAHKEALEPALQKVADLVLAMLNSVGAAKEAAEGAAVPEDVSTGLDAIDGAIKEIRGTLELAAAPPTEAPPDGEPEPGTEDDPMLDEAAKAEEVDKASAHGALAGELVVAMSKLAQEFAAGAGNWTDEELDKRLDDMQMLGWKMRKALRVARMVEKRASDDDVAKLLEGDVATVEKIGRKMSAGNRKAFNASLEKIRDEMQKLFGLYMSLLPSEEQAKAGKLWKRVMDDFGFDLAAKKPDNAGAGTWPENPAGGMENSGTGAMEDPMAQVAKGEPPAPAPVPAAQVVAKSDPGSEIDAPSAGAMEGTVAKGAEPQDPGWPMDLNARVYVDTVRRTGRY
jgi:hypothetical protein